MHRLKEQDLEKLSDLPAKFLSLKVPKGYKDNWKRWGFSYYPIDDRGPHDIVHDIIQKNIGKSFDLAFSYYCKKVPKYFQHYFLDEFNNRRRWRDDYYVDSEGLIQEHKVEEKKKVIRWYSSDYKSISVHRSTGHLKSTFSYKYKRIGKSYITVYTHDPSFRKGDYKRYSAKEDDFVEKVISGYSLTFESRNDPRYIRLVAEKHKKYKQELKRQKLEKKRMDYTLILKENTIKCLNNIAEFKRKQQEQIQREKELNEQVIVRHGFDSKTSFRNV